eukprot:3093251-Rhodomonas_salina.3
MSAPPSTSAAMQPTLPSRACSRRGHVISGYLAHEVMGIGDVMMTMMVMVMMVVMRVMVIMIRVEVEVMMEAVMMLVLMMVIEMMMEIGDGERGGNSHGHAHDRAQTGRMRRNKTEAGVEAHGERSIVNTQPKGWVRAHCNMKRGTTETVFAIDICAEMKQQLHHLRPAPTLVTCRRRSSSTLTISE